MCWNVEASAAMVVVGAAATGVTWQRGQPPGIWLAMGYFTVMEALQLAGYGVLDQCGTHANQAVTWLSYLHIAFQPIVIHMFALELVPTSVKRRARPWALGLAAISSGIMLAQVLPVEAWGSCVPGSPLCADRLCTVSGTWHIAWDIPYNGLVVPVDRWTGLNLGFPFYMFTVFVVPLIYGAWRFVLLHLLAGPVLASSLTSNPNEMPAVWCLFSIVILLIGLSPLVRHHVQARTWYGLRA